MTETILPGQPEHEIIDSLGRTIKVKLLSPRERRQLLKIVGGGDAGANAAYLGSSLLAASVRQIADLPIPLPSSDAAIDAILDRLGDPGWNAIESHFESEAANDQAKVVADAKN